MCWPWPPGAWRGGTRRLTAGVQTLSQTRPDATEWTTTCRDLDRCADVRKLARETDKPELLSDPGHGHLLSSNHPAPSSLL